MALLVLVSFYLASWVQPCTTGRFITKSMALLHGQSIRLLCFCLGDLLESLHAWRGIGGGNGFSVV
jgi:hypothetical protein